MNMLFNGLSIHIINFSEDIKKDTRAVQLIYIRHHNDVIALQMSFSFTFLPITYDVTLANEPRITG